MKPRPRHQKRRVVAHQGLPQTRRLLPGRRGIGPGRNRVRVQRVFKTKGKLAAERVERLEALEFESKPQAAAWEKTFAELEAFNRVHGDCNVPIGWPENPTLASWVQAQRSRKTKGKLAAERVKRLDALEFEWKPRAAVWEKTFTELEAFNRVHGDCNVPIGWPENPKLASWVQAQRSRKTKGKLAAERVKRLDALEFE
jgi:hypothetical protein